MKVWWSKMLHPSAPSWWIPKSGEKISGRFGTALRKPRRIVGWLVGDTRKRRPIIYNVFGRVMCYLKDDTGHVRGVSEIMPEWERV